MNSFKDLSTRYYKDARRLNYTWMDLVKKTTRQEVIDDVILFQNIKMINKAEEDTIRNKLIDKQLKKMEDEVKREHVKIMKQQKTKTEIEQLAKALKGNVESFKISVLNNKDPLLQLQKTRKAIEKHIIKNLTSKKGLKFIETLKVTFMKQKERKRGNLNFGEVFNPFDNYYFKTAFFNSKAQDITNNEMVVEALKLSKDHILNIIAKWISEGSGWTIESVDNHFLNIVQYQLLKGSSYIELPKELRHHMKGLINMKNEDNECFRWCHIRRLNPQDKDPQRIKRSDKEYINKLDYSGIEFPVTVKQYKKIEKQNEININVFGYENKQPYPIYVSKEKYEKHMELLLITEDKNKHYVLIKDFNRFMTNQTKHNGIKHFCIYCLQCFSSERVFNNHKDNCIQVNGTQAVKMPDKDKNILKFNNLHKQQPVPFVIYADFEAITEKISNVNLMMINHIQMHIKNILIVVLVIRLSVVMMINIVNP